MVASVFGSNKSNWILKLLVAFIATVTVFHVFFSIECSVQLLKCIIDEFATTLLDDEKM